LPRPSYTHQQLRSDPDLQTFSSLVPDCPTPFAPVHRPHPRARYFPAMKKGCTCRHRAWSTVSVVMANCFSSRFNRSRDDGSPPSPSTALACQQSWQGEEIHHLWLFEEESPREPRRLAATATDISSRSSGTHARAHPGLSRYKPSKCLTKITSQGKHRLVRLQEKPTRTRHGLSSPSFR
jgi:hypothetical protein